MRIGAGGDSLLGTAVVSSSLDTLLSVVLGIAVPIFCLKFLLFICVCCGSGVGENTCVRISHTFG